MIQQKQKQKNYYITKCSYNAGIQLVYLRICHKAALTVSCTAFEQSEITGDHRSVY